ncbi:DUF6122 family protein [Pedobacter arcticus]|uniref:DUF6122 family protein n=1 Tax=Pedobacter arcticus TaxID=752140 RepID=UPI0009FE6ED9|nr:DUF6122 family protein [Pedobacter arcticus]
MQTIIHYSLHFIVPFFIAYYFFRNDWKKVYLILLATMLIDLDHLLANPIFQPDRCSIGFHPLHSFYIIPFYFALLFFRKPFSIIGIGLVLHVFTDSLDCLITFSHCKDCLISGLILSGFHSHF